MDLSCVMVNNVKIGKERKSLLKWKPKRKCSMVAQTKTMVMSPATNVMVTHVRGMDNDTV